MKFKVNSPKVSLYQGNTRTEQAVNKLNAMVDCPIFGVVDGSHESRMFLINQANTDLTVILAVLLVKAAELNTETYLCIRNKDLIPATFVLNDEMIDFILSLPEKIEEITLTIK